MVLSCPSTVVRAETTEDLLNIYGMTLGGPIRSEIQSKLNQVQSELDAAEENMHYVDSYNSAVNFTKAANAKEISNINSNISSLLTNNNVISNDIENNFLELDIRDLIVKDKEYKSNVGNINNLLKNLDFYNQSYTYMSYSYDFDDIKSRLETTKVLYVEALDAYDLGDVSNLKWICSNDRYVTSRYGSRIDPLNPGTIRFHAGTDYRAPIGTDVGSLFNGVVMSTGWSDTIGYFVIVQHGDNVKTLYCHLSEILVNEGDEVNQYDIIARTGSTGTRCTGPHLHLALYLNGNTYDVDTLFNN